MSERVNRAWTVGEFQFTEVQTSYSINDRDTWYRFRIEGIAPNNELYESLEHALVSAVGEKYTGRRGAGGTAVGTAADWFMRMVGADAYRDMTTMEVREQQEREARYEREKEIRRLRGRND